MTKKSLRVLSVSIASCGLIMGAAQAAADDEDDVLAVIEQYVALEGDLRAQAELIRDDRVQLGSSGRRSDQDLNLRIQIASRQAFRAVQGGPEKWIGRVEDPEIRVYGNTAVASFMRYFHIFPPNAEPINPNPVWLTLVLVKEGGEWGIAHTHASPVVALSN